jgi:hypothetical protein
MTEQTSPKALFAKMASILKAIERIPKRGRNPHFNYDYVLDADVLDSVRTQFAEHGIAFFVSVADFRQEQREGSKTIKTLVEIAATFADGETGETYSVRWIGEADDQQDKGVNKALTAGIKYGLIKTFLIPTGDEDADSSAGSTGARPARRQTTTQAPPPQLGGNAPTQKAPASKPGLFVLTFGKHKGKTIGEIAQAERQYLDWVVSNTTNHPQDVAAIKAYLEAAAAPEPPPGDDQELLIQRRAEFQDVMAKAFGFASLGQLNAALHSRGKPNVGDMTLDQLDAGIAWAKTEAEKNGP